MRASATLFATLLVVFVLATPALALEDGIIDTSSSAPNEEFTHSDFGRVITNASDSPVDVAPRDLRTTEYPILTVTSISAGTFANGIWTVGTLEPGQTASIVYTGDAAPVATPTTTESPPSTTTVAPATTVAPPATTAAAPEELPHTGQRSDLVAFALAGLALIGLGVLTLRATRG